MDRPGSKKRVAVIGAGASGLMASWFASETCGVVLFEKEKKAARKLLVTGNGRCNISNVNADRAGYNGRNKDFALRVLENFSVQDTVDFFSSIGIPFIEEDDGKLFPASLQASVVPKIFEYELARRGVEVRVHRRIDKIIPHSGKFRLVTAGMDEELFDSVILSCGSCAHPSLGASTAGYELAASMKHKVYDPHPVILPINITSRALHRLQGIKWDCEVKVLVKHKIVATSTGELLFTAYGISGPASLKVSRAVIEAQLSGGNPEISLDFFPDQDMAFLKKLFNTITSDAQRKLSFAMLGILKERMPDVILEMSGIDPHSRCGSLAAEERNKICAALKDFRITPGKSRGFSEAVAASGGVDVTQVDPDTMESKLIKGLYITGELLDIDGESGGYNLQFAWSTGALAGRAQNRSG